MLSARNAPAEQGPGDSRADDERSAVWPRWTGRMRLLAVASTASALALAGGFATIVLGVPFGTAFAAIGAPAAVGLAGAALLSSRKLSRTTDKLSSDLDALSRRLIIIEARLTSAEPPPLSVQSGDAVEEVSAEVGLLGEIVRDLAVAVAAHDREVAALKRGGSAEAEPSDNRRREPASRLTAPAPPRSALVPVPTDPQQIADAAPSPRLEERGTAEAVDSHREKAILEAFDSDRIELHLQPIVNLPQRKTRLYEALARLRLADDALLVPAEFLPVLERQGRAPDLDRKILARSAAIARHLSAGGSDALIGCNLSPASLAEPGFLRAVGRLVQAHPDLPGRLVLELSQRCWRTLDAERAGALAALRDRGLAFSFDRATDLRFDPLALADRGVRYVKLPAAMLLDPAAARLDIEVRDLAKALSRAGIRLIAERVEREDDVPDLIDLDVSLAQGFVFAPPRPVRPEVLGGSPPTPAQAESPSAPTTPIPSEGPSNVQLPERLPFRAFLRRAG
jgi:cyclic-di-GMP phosphodiesterase, flagellum assembly factor TipF